jgi:hypothetical protein
MHTKFCLESLNVRDDSKDLDVGGRITVSISPLYEHGIEHSSS